MLSVAQALRIITLFIIHYQHLFTLCEEEVTCTIAYYMHYDASIKSKDCVIEVIQPGPLHSLLNPTSNPVIQI